MRIENILGISILVIVITWVILLVYFMVKNEFAKEVIEPSYPVLGVIAVSFFLFIKLIWIDAPEILESRADITIINDYQTGTMHSLYRQTLGDSMKSSQEHQFGIQEIDKLHFYEAFKPLNVTGLHNHNSGLLTVPKVLLEEIEFVVIQWLMHYQPGTWLSDRNLSSGIQSGGGSFVPLVPAEKNTTVICNAENFPTNRFLAKYPISLILPTGSIIQSQASEMNRTFEILSKYSKATFTFDFSGSGAIQPAHHPLSQRIAVGLGLPLSKEYQELRFKMKWSVEIYKKTRFSPEAKLHVKWFESVKTGLQTSFSTDELLKRFQPPQ